MLAVRRRAALTGFDIPFLGKLWDVYAHRVFPEAPYERSPVRLDNSCAANASAGSTLSPPQDAAVHFPSLGKNHTVMNIDVIQCGAVAA